MRQDDQTYYNRRLLEEEQAAAGATSEAARERHEELAAAYRVRLRYALLYDLIPQTSAGAKAAPAGDAPAADESEAALTLAVPARPA